MVLTCCAFNCNRKATLAENPADDHVTFHCFPRNKQLSQKWVIAIGRKDWNPSKYSRLCSLHFTTDSYDTSGWSSRPKLKSDAVPTIFDLPASQEKTVTPRTPLREENLLLSQLEDAINDKSPVQSVSHLPDDASEASGESETDDLSQFSPEVIIEVQPRIKKARKCFVGDFKNNMTNLSTDDTKSFATIAKKLLDKKNKQLRILRQKNRRLERKVTDLESLLVKLIDERVS